MPPRAWSLAADIHLCALRHQRPCPAYRGDPTLVAATIRRRHQRLVERLFEHGLCGVQQSRAVAAEARSCVSIAGRCERDHKLRCERNRLG